MSDFFSFTVTVRAPRPSFSRRAMGVLADRPDRFAQLVEGGQVVGEGGLGADLLGGRVLGDGPVVDAAGQPVQRGPDRRPEDVGDLGVGQRGERRWCRCRVGAASPRRPGRCPTAAAPEGRRSSALSSSRRTTRMPSGLARPDAILAICLPDPAPTEATSPVSVADLGPQVLAERLDVARPTPRRVREVRRRPRRTRAARGRAPRCGRCRTRGGWPRRRPRRAAAAPRPGRRPAGGPGASASPTGRRTRGPRSWPRPPRRARPARRPAPAVRAGWAGSAARRTRRTRPCPGAAPSETPQPPMLGR